MCAWGGRISQACSPTVPHSLTWLCLRWGILEVCLGDSGPLLSSPCSVNIDMAHGVCSSVVAISMPQEKRDRLGKVFRSHSGHLATPVPSAEPLPGLFPLPTPGLVWATHIPPILLLPVPNLGLPKLSTHMTPFLHLSQCRIQLNREGEFQPGWFFQLCFFRKL